MKKRAVALALCVLLVFQLGLPTAGAAEDVYFTAAEENVLPLSDDTMPFWRNGYLYIPGSMFTGTTRKALGVSYYRSTETQPMILYSGNDRTLYFDVTKNYVEDVSGGTYYPGAVLRNGTVFVPAALVASFFDLQYSVTKVSKGYLVWLRKPGFGLSDKNFADAASRVMADRYAEYQRAKEPVQTEPDTSTTVTLPDTDSVETTQTEEPEIGGKSIYLCLAADASSGAMLDTLSSCGVQAAFFCTLDFLEEQGDLLRRMAATGQSIGLLVDAADETRTVAEQLEAGNQALARATCGMTRLALVENGDDTDLQQAQAAGFRCLEADLDRTAYDLRSSANAAALLKRVSARRGDVSVWLGDTASQTGLRAFLTAAKDADGNCLAWTETA